MAGKKIIYGEEARAALASGLNKVADAVKTTLGPKGRCALLRRPWGATEPTKDGVTVARDITLEDPAEDAGAQLCKQVAMKTNDVAGDGTSTSVLLAQAIVSEALKRMRLGSSAQGIKRGLDKACDIVVKAIEKLSKSVTLEDDAKIRFVASVSGNNETVGNLVIDAFNVVGADGVVAIEGSDTGDLTLDVRKGMQLDRGYISPYFVTDPIAMECIMENPRILLWERKITNAGDVYILLKSMFSGMETRPLLIIADDIDGDALSTLVANRVKQQVPVCAIRAPRFGEQRRDIMSDIAVLTGGTFYAESLGTDITKIDPATLGTCAKLKVTTGQTIFFDGAGGEEAIHERIESLKKLEKDSKDKTDKGKYKERVSKLSTGLAVLKVGAPTEQEAKELRYRVEDSVNATRAALEEGIVPGGGMTLVQIMPELYKEYLNEKNEDVRSGMLAVYEALASPMRCIAFNSGASPDIVVDHARIHLQGYNALTDDYVDDMVEAGIIDPTKVARSALQNAVSIAGTIVTTETLIYDLPEENQPQ